MIDWVDEACKSWGRCTLWIINTHDEGWPTMDTIARARSGLVAIGEGTARQKFPEVRLGDALGIARSILEDPPMALNLTATLWAQYVVNGRARHKLPALSRYLGEPISIAEYWRNIDRAHHFIAGRFGMRIGEVVPLSKC